MIPATRVLLSVFLLSTIALAQSRVERNIVYGMYSGTALLMDVHYPVNANGLGVIFVPGSGWSADTAYSAAGIKDGELPRIWVPPLDRHRLHRLRAESPRDASVSLSRSGSRYPARGPLRPSQCCALQGRRKSTRWVRGIFGRASHRVDGIDGRQGRRRQRRSRRSAERKAASARLVFSACGSEHGSGRCLSWRVPASSAAHTENSQGDGEALPRGFADLVCDCGRSPDASPGRRRRHQCSAASRHGTPGGFAEGARAIQAAHSFPAERTGRPSDWQSTPLARRIGPITTARWCSR